MRVPVGRLSGWGIGWAAMLAAWAAAAGAAEPVAMSSRIAAVTVYSDRARVTREAEADLPAGETQVAFAKLPGWVDEESVRLSLSPADAGEIVDVQVRREYLAKTTDEELLRAEQSVQEAADRIAALDDEKKVLDVTAKHVEDIRVFSLEKMPRDAALQGIKVADYAGTVEFIGGRLKEIGAARRDIEKRRRELQPELSARQKVLGDLQARRQLEQCAVVLTVKAAAARKVRLSMSCLMPGAGWEPVHELRSAGAEPTKVTMISCAVVSQTTGEDWNGAELTFSTQSPSDVLAMPEPDAVLLERQPVGAVAVANKSATSFSNAQRVYAEQNLKWYAYNGYAGAQNDVIADNTGRLNTLQNRINRLFAELSRRGTTAQYAGEGRPAVRADGRAVRVVIGQAELAARPGILAVPAKTLNAVRTVALVNTSKQPLLPGRVALYESGAFLGQTDMNFVSDGEAFSLVLGVADQIKLSRVMDQKKSAIVRGARNRIEAAFVISVENLSGKPAVVKLMDRLPVSQDKEIRVSGVDIEPGAKPDPRGLVEWQMGVPPKEKRTVHIGYTLEYPMSYTAPARRAVRTDDAVQQAAPAAAEFDLQEQIRDLEAKF